MSMLEGSSDGWGAGAHQGAPLGVEQCLEEGSAAERRGTELSSGTNCASSAVPCAEAG